MSKFFVKKDDISGENICISNEDVNHITKVLRLSEKNSIIICDGQGMDYEAEIVQIEKKRILCKILKAVPSETEPEIQVTIYQGIPKAAKMEYIIQKAVELGVHKIVPVTTKYTVVKLEEKKTMENKLERWNKISIEASKQCGRGKIPSVELPISFDAALKQLQKEDLRLIAYEQERGQSIRDVLKSISNVRRIGILIGSEGGFAEEEVLAAKAAGVQSIGLGKRILRTETAPIAALSILMYEFGEM